MTRILPEQRPTRISFWVASANTDMSDGHFIVGNEHDSDSMVYFHAENDGRFELYTSSSYDGGAYTSNTWYYIEFRNIDWDNKEFDFYVNGDLWYSNIPFRNNYYDYVNKISLFNYDNSQAKWDEIGFE